MSAMRIHGSGDPMFVAHLTEKIFGDWEVMAFRALSIDGGGMRGIYTASYLNSLERSFAQKRGLTDGQRLDVGKGFNLIVGTSTGAIIGCGLAYGTSPEDMMRLYREHGAGIFQDRMPSSIGLDLIKQLFRRPKALAAGDDALRTALTDIFQATTVKDIWDTRKIALAVTAVNMATYRAWVFKTPHEATSNHRDDLYSLVDICMASSAAPLYRSLAAIKHPTSDDYEVFSDGGLWANNPVLVALIETLRTLGERDDDIEIYALGSCGKPEGEVIAVDDVHRGLLEWRFGGYAAKLSIAAQEYAFDEAVKMLRPFLKRKVTITRFPADKVPGAMLQFLDLDETRPEGLDALVRQGRQDANTTNSEIQNRTPSGVLIEALFNSMPIK